jgi:hypothetical protein
MRSAIVMARHLDKLGPAPAECSDYISAVTALVGDDWGMMGNDTVGDCTLADPCHTIMLRTANAGTMVQPSTQDALDAYAAATGYDPSKTQPDGSNPTDQGANELDICEFMRLTGILGHKNDQYGTIDAANEDHLRWCVQLFGACRIGVNLPQSAMDQFNAGQAWDDVGDQNIIGGHDVPVVDYRGGMYYIITWAKLQPVTPKFMFNQSYVEEAHPELAFDWIRQQGTAPNGLDLAALEADLKGLTNG